MGRRDLSAPGRDGLVRGALTEPSVTNNHDYIRTFVQGMRVGLLAGMWRRGGLELGEPAAEPPIRRKLDGYLVCASVLVQQRAATHTQSVS
jgi:hypothetical protein